MKKDPVDSKYTIHMITKYVQTKQVSEGGKNKTGIDQ